jgi:hypothetical protein
MQKLLILLAGIILIAPAAHAARTAHTIQCSGYVSFENGTMQGNSTVTLVEIAEGRWALDMGAGYLIDGGNNLSSEPGRLLINTYSFFRREGVKADYDFARRVLTFKYKYDSGFLGGGTQKTAGTFTECEELNAPSSQACEPRLQ